MPVVHDEYNTLDHQVAFSRDLAGKECQRCKRALPYRMFNHSSSSRDGYANVCPRCEATPKLSAAENYSKYREDNFNSEAVASQRRPNEVDYLERDSAGRLLYHSDFLHKLKSLLGTKLITAPAHFLNELSLYIEDSREESKCRYIGFIETGLIQEFSSYEYNEYAVPIKETRRGYRGLLMKLIQGKYVTEEQIKKTFGACDEKIWCRTLQAFRNNPILESK